MSLSPQLLEILVCPLCKGELTLVEENDRANTADMKVTSWLICKVDSLKFPVRDGIPIMLVDEADKLAS